MLAVQGDDFEFEYLPSVEAASPVLGSCRPSRFLLLGPLLRRGQGLPDGHETAEECRHLEQPDVALPQGVYRFGFANAASVMLVTAGTTPVPAERGGFTRSGSSALENSARWFEHLWEQAARVPDAHFEVAQDVMLVPDGSEAQVRSRRYSDGAWLYTVRSDGSTLSNLQERFLAEFDINADPADWVLGPLGTETEITAALTRAKLRERLTDTVYSFRASRTVLLPYQFRPVIRMVRTGSQRLLIADEVGMGKTIEAGLVWSELEARNQADRVLVVCPAGLVEKWKSEMWERFSFDMFELDPTGLNDLVERLETDRFPSRYHAVCSMQRLRSWQDLEQMNDLSPHFDLIIVDEAHAMRNTGTRSFALGSLLSDWADVLLFLSATPLNLGSDDLFNLLNLIDPGTFFDKHTLQMQLRPNAALNAIYRGTANQSVSNRDLQAHLQSIRSMLYGRVTSERREFKELERMLASDDRSVADSAQIRHLCLELNTLSTVLTRTRRAEIDETRPLRQPRDIPVNLTREERRLYDAIQRWQAERAEVRDMPLNFIGQTALRLAGSCLPAIRDQVLAGDLNQSDVGSLNEDEPSEHDDEDRLEQPPSYVIDAALALNSTDTKFGALVGALEEMVQQHRRVLLFTFSRPVVAYLHTGLEDRFRVAVLHGDVPQSERRRRIAEFRAGNYDIILATRVASEGLDFEFCDAVVNYDLPWNPMEIEQRIGRIDRYGQQSETIYVLNFTTPGTIETDILYRVHQRIGVFLESIGELEPILQEEFSDIRDIIFDFRLTHEERQAHIQAALLTVEERARIQREFDDSSDLLNALDHGFVDTFESDVVGAGHYVGQPELACLLREWVLSSPGGQFRLSADGHWLLLSGDSQLEQDLRQVQRAGERSSAEIDRLASDLRNDMQIRLCLDQEVARVSNADLLSANHPLVRAALRANPHRSVRFGAASVQSRHLVAGHYLVLVAIARWNGLRPAAELWTAACGPADDAVSDDVGTALLTSLAQADLRPVVGEVPEWNAEHVADCEDRLRVRQAEQQQRREQDNAVQVEARRVSLRDSHARKVANLRERVAAAERAGQEQAARLLRSQVRAQDTRLREAEMELDSRAGGLLSLEYLALCSLEVVP